MHRLSVFFLAATLGLALPGSGASAAPEADPAPAPLSHDGFVAALAADFANHFTVEGELQLEVLRAWAAPARVARTWSVEVAEYPTVLSTAMVTRCRVLADGQLAGEYSLTLRAALWRDAWVARQPLTVNSAFDPAQLELRRVDFLRERDALPATVGDHGFMFARSVQAERLLTWRDVSRRPLVRKGDMVEVAAIDGLLQVTMKAIALESGAQGDTVTVRNPESHKDFAAQVVAESRVQIRF